MNIQISIVIIKRIQKIKSVIHMLCVFKFLLFTFRCWVLRHTGSLARAVRMGLLSRHPKPGPAPFLPRPGPGSWFALLAPRLFVVSFFHCIIHCGCRSNVSLPNPYSSASGVHAHLSCGCLFPDPDSTTKSQEQKKPTGEGSHICTRLCTKPTLIHLDTRTHKLNAPKCEGKM